MINAPKLKGRMVECGMTQADLASALGLSQATVSQKLSGTRPIFLSEADKIAEVLAIPDAEFRSYFFNRDLRSAKTEAESI